MSVAVSEFEFLPTLSGAFLFVVYAQVVLVGVVRWRAMRHGMRLRHRLSPRQRSSVVSDAINPAMLVVLVYVAALVVGALVGSAT